MLVLGIESSCDETGLAIYSEQYGLLGHLVNSQVDLFTEYGGVIPEIAARDHSVKIIHILKELLKKAKVNSNEVELLKRVIQLNKEARKQLKDQLENINNTASRGVN